MKKLVIVGSGWLGEQLFAHFEQLQLLQDWQLHATRRNVASFTGLTAKVQKLAWLGEQDAPDIESNLQDAVWLIAMSPGRDRSAYLASLQHVVDCAHLWQCRHLLLCSSTGVYSQLAGKVDECSQPVSGNARVDGLLAAEQLVQSFPNSTVLRLAGLFGEGRHPGRFCKAGQMAGAELPVNLVHSEQVAAVIAALLEQPAAPRVVNLVHPEHPSKQQFYSQAAALYGIAAPSFSAADEPARWVTTLHQQQAQWPALLQYLQNIKNL